MIEKNPFIEQFQKFDILGLPIGIYMVDMDGQFVVCNRTLRKMLGLPLNGDVRASTLDFYADKRQRDELIKLTLENDKQGKNLERASIHFKVDGKDIYVEDYCKALRDEDTAEIIGFVGCLVDITDEYERKQHERELQDRVKELTFDIGRILHANTTTLVMVKQTLDAVVEAFEPKPYQGTTLPTAKESETMLVDHANALATMIERFLEVADGDRRRKALPPMRWKKLSEYVNFLREFQKRISTPELWTATLRKIANDVGNIHASIKPGYIAREPARELETAAWHLERLTNLIEVLHTRVAVIQMDYSIHSLRETITSDTRIHKKKELIGVKFLIEQCTIRLAEYARSLQVEFDYQEIEDAEVFVNEREMVRALSNLLHNAIKYSWHRDPEKLFVSRAAWVSIDARVEDKKVYLEFQNWGVPIKIEEIEKEKLFEVGYRGELSKDRGRLGTGIGLTDARRVAEAHDGALKIESRPASRYSVKSDHPEYYKQPFITTAIMSLPLAVKK